VNDERIKTQTSTASLPLRDAKHGSINFRTTPRRRPRVGGAGQPAGANEAQPGQTGGGSRCPRSQDKSKVETARGDSPPREQKNLLVKVSQRGDGAFQKNIR
jgi:hypothetical protein